MVAENGVAGLETYIDLRDQIRLVLTDIIMPVMSGIEMALKIVELDNQAKILLMSGYNDSVIESQARSRFPFIRKPFIHHVLIEKIRWIVGTGEAASATE